MTASVAWALLSSLFSVIRTIVVWMEQRKWMEEGHALAIKESLDELSKVVATAKAARESVKSDAARDPASVMREDEFTRRGE